MEVQFFFLNCNISLKKRKALKMFIKDTFFLQKRKLYHLKFIFCSDEYLLSINKKYLKHNYYTDIITFNFSDNPKIIEGEIYISTDRVKDNATQFGVTIKEELHRVIFHGILHLCGYKDKSQKDISKMRNSEKRLLKAYFK